MKIANEGLQASQLWIKGLKSNTLSHEIGQISHPLALEALNTCSFKEEVQVGKLIKPDSVNVVISHKRDISFVPGCRVQQMGHQERRGFIIEGSGDRFLVKWGYGSQTWHPSWELYPINESGAPFIPGEEANIFEAARRGRMALGEENKDHAARKATRIDSVQLDLF